MKTERNRENFAKGLAEGAKVVLRSYPIILKYVPITFDVDNLNDLSEIAAKSRSDPNQVISARWAKDPTRRRPNQAVAFLVVELKTPEVANKIITTGAYVHGKRCEAKKFLPDPQRCNKCQRYGHVTAICRSELPRCGHCARDHWTSKCETESNASFCANCNISGHSARDITCQALDDRIKTQDSRNPERKLKFYPTVDAWTHELNEEYKEREKETNINGKDLRSITFSQ